MAESVYKVIELVGTSEESWEKAASAAVTQAAGSLRDLRIAEVVKLQRPARRIGQIDRAKRRNELFFVAHVTAHSLQAGFDHLAIDVQARSVEAGNGVEILRHTVRIEFLIRRRLRRKCYMTVQKERGSQWIGPPSSV